MNAFIIILVLVPIYGIILYGTKNILPGNPQDNAFSFHIGDLHLPCYQSM